METVHQRLSRWLAAACLALALFEVPRAFADSPPIREDRSRNRRRSITWVRSSRCLPATASRVMGRSSLEADCGLIRPRPRSKAARAGLRSSRGQGGLSPLVAAVRGEGATERMPLNRPPLSASEIRLLQDWIDQGVKAIAGERPGLAPSQSHWAFSAPRSPAVPDVANLRWARNAIDRFIEARLERAGVPPSAEADRATLLRRVSLDLVGLPPSPHEIDVFLADRSENAYERAVDRLMASPHFGERWARPWLDQARYADSNGFNIDAPRSIWKYRDWVIDAFNAGMPFDQFTIDQIAGDLRPGSRVRAADRHRVSSKYADQPGRGDRRRAVPGRGRHRPGQHHGDGLSRPDDRLRPVPRPQVRPGGSARLLPALRLFQQRG